MSDGYLRVYPHKAGWGARIRLLLQLRRMRFLVFLALVMSRVARSGLFDGNGEYAQSLLKEVSIGCG
jgi:hypothetical protein